MAVRKRGIPLSPEVRQRLVTLRLGLGMSREDLAKRARVSRNWVLRVEHGTARSVDEKVLAQVANTLGRTLGEILYSEQKFKAGAEESVSGATGSSPVTEGMLPEAEGPEPESVALRVLVWESQHGGYLPIRGAVRENDRIKIFAKAKAPSYLFVGWVDQYGRPNVLHPLLDTAGKPLEELRRVQLLRIPNVADDEPGRLKTNGAPGLETIVLMVRRELTEGELYGGLHGLLKLPSTRGQEWLLKVPVTAKLTREMQLAQGTTRKRTPVVEETPARVQELQQILAKRLVDKFDEVWVCTFANLGRPRRLR
jgi:transcriptional regulator with XRE-family HTH domain